MIRKYSSYFSVLNIGFTVIFLIIFSVLKRYMTVKKARSLKNIVNSDALEDYYDAKAGHKALKEHCETGGETLSIDDVMKRWKVK
ncbi:hypothetical protein [Staphylococcus equorum]|uniref:Uncharacterized protein n=1 Tax=Staphylococcus equorum TaxID=246432 RepID=A0AAP7LUZ7_9STAP|nr:hypothetical protein [Staphylococcus equorum]OEK58836.1 hypothetical protein ASS94_01395 [Staphylococcus equorum]